VREKEFATNKNHKKQAYECTEGENEERSLASNEGP
jgi:hypothetical protein